MKTVLVVDDSAFYREIVRDTLEKECGVQVIEAPNGSIALNILADQKPSIDVAILDMMMMGHGGTVREYLLKTPQYKNTQILYYTGLDPNQID